MGPMMQTLNLNLASRPLRMAAATVLLAIAAGTAQTALAQPGDHHRHQYRGQHRGGDGMALMHPRQVERVLDSVNATPEQRAQIRQIVQSARNDLQGQRDARRQLHEQSQALFAQPTVDARAAEALRQQMLAQHDQASQRKLQALLEVSRVLTPEQRKSLADRMAQRKAMMERHRAERAAQPPATR